MNDEYVTLAVHQAFAEKIEAEDNRQNRRIENIESEIKQISELVTSVKVLAVNMENMAKEQAKMGERLNEIEQKPVKRWDTIVGEIITGVIGILIGLVSAGILK